MSTMLRRVPPLAWPAIGIVLGFGVLHLAGARDAVSVLSGTPVEGMSMALAGALGAGYVLAYFGAVLLAPILFIAAALSYFAQKVSDARRLPRPGVKPSSTPSPRSA